MPPVFGPTPKSPGDLIRSQDWNEAMAEVVRLESAKLNLTGGTVSGPLSVQSLGLGTVGSPQAFRPLTVRGAAGTYLNVIANGGTHEVLLGADAAGGIVSTMTNHDLQLRAGGNVPRLTIKADGKVGIGTTNPQGALDVNGAIRAGTSDVYFTNPNHNHSLIGNALGFAAIENAADYNTLMILGRTTPPDLKRSVSVWDELNVNGSLAVTGVSTFNGKVGIGTTTPQGALDVNGAIRAGTSDVYFTNPNHNHSLIGNALGFAAIENAADYNTLMILGRTTPPDLKRSVSVWDELTVNGSLTVTGASTANGDITLEGDLYIRKTGDGYARFMRGTFSNENTFAPNNLKLSMASTSGFSVVGTPSMTYEFAIGHTFTSPIITGGGGGRIVPSFQKKFSVNQDGNVTIAGALMAGGSDVYFTGTNHNHTGIGNTAGFAAIENSLNYNTLMILGRTVSLSPFRRSVTVWEDLTVAGNLTVNGSKSGFIVENFINAVGDLLEQGDVVVLGGDEIGHYYGAGNSIPVPEVDVTDRAYDTRVCGIVDLVVRADNLPPYEMPTEEEVKAAQAEKNARRRKAAEKALAARSVHPLQALAAPVAEGLDATQVQAGQLGKMVTLGAYAWCKVDADIAAIAVGDLLTTSPTRGHAQKVTEPARAVGAILGKALGALKKGKGKIPVLVSLQ